MMDFSQLYREQFELFYKEDDINKNLFYMNTLPSKEVNCHLKIKDDLVLAGLPIFFASFNYLKKDIIDGSNFLDFEGKRFSRNEKFQIDFKLPFNIALTGERIALNLIQRASSIATNVGNYLNHLDDICILDTRKTTPGLRFLEKYAVRIGGGNNHRFSQMDAWMVKDNHKKIFGGVDKAINYFHSMNTFYQPIIVEIHDLSELEVAIKAGGTNFLLDNFSPSDISEAVKIKRDGMTFEASGGIHLENIKDYNITGLDAISSGALIYNARTVDLSLKFS